EANLGAEHTLGFEIGVADRVVRERCRAARTRHRSQGTQRRICERLLTRAAIRAAKTQLVDDRWQKWPRPGLVARHPRQTHLRIRRELRLAPERAVVVHAHRPREKESVVERQLL